MISLDHRVMDSVSTRRLRVVKYRGSTHGSNEYPFLIDRDGNIRNIYGSDTLDPRLVLADVRSLLMEAAAPKPSPALTTGNNS